MTKRLWVLVAVLVTLAGCATDVGDPSDSLTEGEDGLPAELAAAVAAADKGPIGRLVAGEEQLVAKDGEQQISGPGPGNPNQGYDLYIKTGSVENAGTSARVYFTMCSVGSGAWICAKYFLDNPNRNDWERGHLDDFHPRGIDLGGKVDWVRLEHDNSKNKPGWYLEYVNTHDLSRNQNTTCPVHQWLATDSYPNRLWTEKSCSNY